MGLSIKEYNHEINNELSVFSKIDLDEMNRAKLMKRLDHKFLISSTQLLQLLKPMSAHYSILEINTTVNHKYTSLYYDTLDNDMYLSHHNKRVNRYKIRHRTYYSSGDSFLEIKFKDNKGITHKQRTATSNSFTKIPYEYFNFIQENSKYSGFMLRPSLENSFNRLTLTNPERNQRITIDTNIAFWLNSKPLVLPNLAIVEVKSTKNKVDKSIFQLFKENQIYPNSMSKYSIGLAMLSPKLKQNLFKNKILTLNKISHEQ